MRTSFLRKAAQLCNKAAFLLIRASEPSLITGTYDDFHINPISQTPFQETASQEYDLTNVRFIPGCASIVQPSGKFVGQADEDVVSVLGKILDKAKSGEIVSIAVGITFQDGGTGCSYAGHDEPSLILGSIEMLKLRLHAAFIDSFDMNAER